MALRLSEGLGVAVGIERAAPGPHTDLGVRNLETGLQGLARLKLRADFACVFLQPRRCSNLLFQDGTDVKQCRLVSVVAIIWIPPIKVRVVVIKVNGDFLVPCADPEG